MYRYVSFVLICVIVAIYSLVQVFMYFQLSRNTTLHEFKSLDGERFLIPVLLFGPNNQLVALKQSAYLAWKLNRTLVIPPFEPHYTVQSKDHISSKNIIEVVSTPFTPKAIFLEDFLIELQRNRLDAVVFLQRDYYQKYLGRVIKHFDAANVILSFSKIISTPNFKRDCMQNSDRHDNMVFSDQFLVLPMYEVYKECDFHAKDAAIDYYNTFAAIQIKRSIRQRVETLVRNGIKNCYVCAHFRPTPDHGHCVKDWGTDKASVPLDCKKSVRPLFWYEDKIAMGLSSCPTKNGTVFVAYFPKMNPDVLNRIVKKYNAITSDNVFLSGGTMSGFEISLYEQMVCSMADYFVPTIASTWSTMVHQQRILWAEHFGMSPGEMWEKTLA